MNIHVLSQPHTQVTKDYLRCAYTMKVLKFCNMMISEGHKVTLYASEENETSAELVTCITKRELSKLGFNSPDDYLKNDFDNRKPLWKIFHQRAIYEMKKRILPKDIIVTFSGLGDRPVSDAFPDAYFVEGGIGYSGVFSNFKIFESYAWMNTVNGSFGNPSALDGKFYDRVIPNYFDISDFPYAPTERGDYILYVGRMIHRKGLKIIEEMAKRLPNQKFIFAGQGAEQKGNKIVCQELTMEGDNLEYVGILDSDKRFELMGKAKFLVCPTLYIPPFEGVHVEAMLCGTPVLTTPFGVFNETVIDGFNGFRCHKIKEFVEALNLKKDFNHESIRNFAIDRYSMDVVKKQYTKYFEHLKGLESGGFYE
jgi:glycosyltransferase involved in cell wall biosynthesis